MSSSPRYVLAILMVIYVFNFIDRQILSILLESIKLDLGVSDLAMGFLTGTAFALFYTTAGIPIARLADRGSRVAVISIGLVAWSAMTAASGLARSFWQLAAARVLVGVGEAAASPASHSLISDYFPPDRRATALALYMIGGQLGALLALAGGGWIDQWFGWRVAFLVVGLPGIGLAVIAWTTLREPARGQSDAGVSEVAEVRGAWETVRYLFGQATFRQLVASLSLYSFGTYGLMVWAPTFLRRVHEMSPGEAGSWSGLIVGGGGALGHFLGGWVCDRLRRRHVRWMMLAPALTSLAVVPLLVGMVLSRHSGVALALWAPAAILGAFYPGPSYAVAHDLAKLRMRAMASAILLFAGNLVGLGLSPLVIGLLNDLLAADMGSDAIRYSLMFGLVFTLWGVAHGIVGARTLERDLVAHASTGGA